ncbi:GGDEF domain-containing protein [Candidatus Omnitrophota bacterium]
MLYLVFLVILSAVLIIGLDTRLRKSLVRAQAKQRRMEREEKRLSLRNKRLWEENLKIERTASQTLALYDIARQICKSLDQKKLFDSFRGLIDRYIKVDDCKFLKQKPGPGEYSGYTRVPLRVDKELMGYLLASNVNYADADKFQILAQQFLLGAKRAFLYQKVQELAITDSLTGALSRRYWRERFQQELERSKNLGHKLCCMMADIDNFKDYNDRYGHLVGDTVLKEVARTVKENIRQIDLFGRYGGDEFLIALIETDKEGARFAAERMRQEVERRKVRVYDEELKVTISFGIAEFSSDAMDAQALIDWADTCLYRAKHEGRNRVVTA